MVEEDTPRFIISGGSLRAGGPRETTDHVCTWRTVSSVNVVPAFMGGGHPNNVPNLKFLPGQNPPAPFLPSQRFLDSG